MNKAPNSPEIAPNWPKNRFIRLIPTTLLVMILANCSRNPEKKPDTASSEDSAQVVTSNDSQAYPSQPRGEVSMPNNDFKNVPERPQIDQKMIDKVTAITLAQRNKTLIAKNGGGKASDEVIKLEGLGVVPFMTLADIQSAFQEGQLMPLPSIEKGRYFSVGPLGEADFSNAPWYSLIHPDAYERFNEHVAKVFYAQTGKMLRVTGLVRSEAYQQKLRGMNIQATKSKSPHTFGRTIDFSIPQVFNPTTRQFESMSSSDREFISQLLAYYETKFPERTSWLVESGNAYHGTHYPKK